jgi:hypothetical protein
MTSATAYGRGRGHDCEIGLPTRPKSLAPTARFLNGLVVSQEYLRIPKRLFAALKAQPERSPG